MMPVYVLVQGMYLRTDSIAYDAAFQVRLLRRWGVPAELYAGEFDAENYPDVEAKRFEDLSGALRRNPGPVLYHWVDGWDEGDDLLLRSSVPVILRWHNNTPPWFFAKYSSVPTHKTVRGFLELLRVADALPDARLWTNSEFSRRQLQVLGIDGERIDVVYPASAYLESDPKPETSATAEPGEPIRLLFVGRLVPHKGHFHLLAAARGVAEMTGRRVQVCLPGRPDYDMERYVPEIRLLAERLGVDLELPGEISHPDLESAYRDADVFVGLSEHEGFGLPILEAMTRGLPVVGYRCSAVSELLRDHPLAVDELDPEVVARRIVAALDPAARNAIAAWQETEVLPRFSRGAIENQIHAAIDQLDVVPASRPEPGSRTSTEERTAAPAPRELLAAVERARALPRPDLDLPSVLPRDTNPHFVTRYDLDAYRSLLATRRREHDDLRHRALELEFTSHRGTFGGVMGRLKAGILRLQDGLIRTIALSHDDLEDKIAEANERIEFLSAELKILRRTAQRRNEDP